MAGAKGRKTSGWSALLAQPGGPNGVHDQVLRIVRRIAEGPRKRINARALVVFDDAIAAVATLAGAAAAREALAPVSGMLAEINQRLTLFPTSIDDLAALSLLSSMAVAEPIGVRLALSALDVGKTLDRFAVQKQFSREDKITAALVALSSNHAREARFILVGTVARTPDPGDPLPLVEMLASAMERKTADAQTTVAWEAFLAAFPSALASKQGEWNHLLLAARIVMAQLGSVPMADVADTLHRRVVELAAVKPS